MEVVIVFHANCHDGITALWAALQKFPKAEPYPGRYDQPPDLERLRGKHVVVVDFSWKRPHMLAVLDACDTLEVYDHHKTAEADLAGLDGINGCRVVFDMQRSGAGLAWDELVGGPRPKLVDYVEDRDLWRFALPYSREVHAACASYPLDLEHRARLATRLEHPAFLSDLVGEGTAILRYHRQLVEEACKTAALNSPAHVLTGWDNVPVVHTANMALVSDIGAELLRLHPTAPFAVSVVHLPDDTLKFFLRSEDGRADVAEVAKKYGGGGHRNAAGFENKPGA